MKKINIITLLVVSFLITSCQTTIVRYQSNSVSDFSINEQNKNIILESDTNIEILHTEYGLITFYADDFHGKPTANGEIFDMNKFSAAHIKFPLNTIIRVTNLKNSKSVIVRVNDRMPPNNKGRILDVSKATAIKLDFVNDGVVNAKIEVLKWGDGKKVDNNIQINPIIRYR